MSALNTPSSSLIQTLHTTELSVDDLLVLMKGIFTSAMVDPGGLRVIILASGSIPTGVDGFFQSVKIPQYDFLRKGSKAVGSVS